MPTWLSIVLALGGSALISNIVSLIVHNWDKKRIDKKEKEQQEFHKLELENQELRYRQSMDKIRQDDEAHRVSILAEVSKMLEPIKDQLNGITEALKLDKEANIVNIRVSLKNMRNRYMKQGYADSSDKATWNELYNRYREMGGNHFKEWVDEWKSDIEHLPVKPPVDDDK